jgi:hypothetical protein
MEKLRAACSCPKKIEFFLASATVRESMRFERFRESNPSSRARVCSSAIFAAITRHSFKSTSQSVRVLCTRCPTESLPLASYTPADRSFTSNHQPGSSEKFVSCTTS